MLKVVLKHFAIGLLLLMLIESLSTVLFYLYSIDAVWWSVIFIIKSFINIVFMLIFGFMQTAFKRSLCNTILVIGFMAVTLLSLSTAYYLLPIDWIAVQLNEVELLWWQQLIHNDISFWMIYLIVLMISLLVGVIKSRNQQKT